MKERQMLFNAPMVRALLAGTKAQTRRIIKPQPQMVTDKRIEPWRGDPAVLLSLLADSGRKCPYGQPGDRIWGRETFFAYGRWVTRYSEKKGSDEWHFIDMTAECDRTHQYDADSPDVPLAAGRGGALPGWYKRPSIFMPRAASRILLEIVSVRVERLNDCSDADARAEGVAPDQVRQISVFGANDVERAAIYRRAAIAPYERLWESINGAGSWAANPWVWVIEFKRVPLHHQK
ncbi:hypothetical protein KO538_00140 [Janthinobacterium sp. NKUCC08_JDC]|nr:hypothetical protein [Janthinobacterium sp. NKUCC08_JDC]